MFTSLESVKKNEKKNRAVDDMEEIPLTKFSMSD